MRPRGLKLKFAANIRTDEISFDDELRRRPACTASAIVRQPTAIGHFTQAKLFERQRRSVSDGSNDRHYTDPCTGEQSDVVKRAFYPRVKGDDRHFRALRFPMVFFDATLMLLPARPYGPQVKIINTGTGHGVGHVLGA